jgi:hypothetical protein
VALLGKLGVVERLIRRLEVAAAVLPVGVEEQGIELAVEIVVMRDVAPRPRPRIELHQAAIEVADEPLRSRPERRLAVPPLPEDDAEHVGNRALLDDEAAVHIGLAEPQLWIKENAAFGRMAVEADGDRLA